MLKNITKLTFNCFLMSIVLVVIGVYLFIIDNERRSIKLTSDNVKIVLSETEWTKNDLKLTIQYDNNASRYIKGYSFDGGKSWTTNNSLDIKDNQEIKLAVKDINNHIYSLDYKVGNIDREGPIIEVEDNIQVTRGSKVNLSDYITVTDEISGLRDEVVLTPATINTNVKGTYTVQIYAIDKVANKTISKMTINVVDKAPEVFAKSISLDHKELDLKLGEENLLVASITPKSTTNKNIKWTSSDPSVATVDVGGKVVGIKSGIVTITATTSNGLTATCDVKIK